MRFYMPKMVLCGLIWIALTASIGYINYWEVTDPSFSWRDDLDGTFHSVIQAISVLLFVLYSSYFVIVAYSSLL